MMMNIHSNEKKHSFEWRETFIQMKRIIQSNGGQLDVSFQGKFIIFPSFSFQATIEACFAVIGRV